jgi:hypothetical protein
MTDLSESLRGYDYCMTVNRGTAVAMSGDDDLISEIGRVYLDHLTLVGINWILVSSLNKKHIYVLLKAKLNVLNQLAMDLEYQLLLDPTVLQKVAEEGDREEGISPIKIQHVPQESPMLPYHHIYAPFRHDQEVNQALYWRPTNMSHPFRELVRMKLTHLLIETKLLVPTPTLPDLQQASLSLSQNQAATDTAVSNQDGAISIRRAIMNGHVIAFFPLHHVQSREHLAKIWLVPWALPWQYPMEEIKVLSCPLSLSLLLSHELWLGIFR